MASTRVRRDTRDGAARRPDRGRVIPRRRARMAPGPHKRQWCESRGEAEVDNVAVLHDVILAFEPDLTAIAARGHRAARDQRIVADHFRANEPPRDVAVNLAGGEIHSDIARGFIRAEVVGYDSLIARGSMAACRDRGEVRLEGKDYIVQDGDIINFRFAT